MNSLNLSVMFLVTEGRFFLSHRLQLANFLKSRGFEVFVCTAPGEFDSQIRDAGFTLCPVSFHRSSLNPLGELRVAWDVAKYVRAIRPTHVHAIGLKPTLTASILSFFYPLQKFIATLTGLGFVFTTRRLKGLVLKIPVYALFLLQRTQNRILYVFQNPDDRILFLQKKLMTVNKTFLVRGSGVDTNKYVYSEEPKGPIKVVFPARLLKDKGIREFIEAIRILKVRPGFKAEFLLCGDLDPLNPTSVSRNEVESWTRENLVQWVGFSDDMPNTYRNCHLVVLPSYREGLPLALIEAASAGRAIVTTDVPGCREIVVHGYNGYLAKLQDPHSLAEYIEMLISNPLMRNEMGKNGRKLVEEHFAMEIVHRQMLSIYLEVSKN